MEQKASHNAKKIKKPVNPEKPAFRYSRVIFSVFMCILTIFLVWPGYSLFSSAEPLILGLPLSFAWVVFCTVAGFVAMALLYYTDYIKEEAD
jgi:TRAP-type C4-dicarboxylate transport system permease small subunit